MVGRVEEETKKGVPDGYIRHPLLNDGQRNDPWLNEIELFQSIDLLWAKILREPFHQGEPSHETEVTRVHILIFMV